jgi:hypothetical protein
MGKAIEAEVKKYVEEAYPLVRERAVRLAPSTLGAALEEKFSEDELKQLLAWLESPVNKKFQTLGPVRNAFVQKVLAESVAAVDPKVGALDARIRVILGVPPANQAPASSGSPPARPAAPPPGRAASRRGRTRSAWLRPRPAASRRSPFCASRSTPSTPSCSS